MFSRTRTYRRLRRRDRLGRAEAWRRAGALVLARRARLVMYRQPWIEHAVDLRPPPGGDSA